MKKILSFAAIVALMLTGCTVKEFQQEPVEENLAVEESENIVHGILNVKFDTQTTADIEKLGVDAAMEAMSAYGVSSMERLFPDGGDMEPAQREAGLHRWYKVHYSSVVAATKASEGVADLFPDAIVNVPRKKKLTAIPFNDPYKSYQWFLENTGTCVSGAVQGVDVNVLPVWERTGGTSNVIVNVVDAGVSMGHPDLAGVVIPGGENGSRNFVNNSYTITPEFHGTHVSGIIAAINNNGEGGCSIAGGLDGNGGVRILNSQIFTGEESAGEESDAAAIVWGANHGAVISTNSWGFAFQTEEEAMSYQVSEYQAITDAIDYFIKYAGCDAQGKQAADSPMKGGLVFFAAGNDNFCMGHPAYYPSVIAVGAVGPSGRKAVYSQYGSWVDICAPGGDYDSHNQANEAMILAPGYQDENAYYFAEGTSMSCPMVSGVAALLVSLYGGPGFTADKLKSMLLEGANYNYGVSESIGPLVDAAGAMNAYSGEETAPVIHSSYDGDYKIKGHEILDVDYTVVSQSAEVEIEVECGAGAEYTIDDRSINIVYNDGTGTRTGKYKATITATSLSGLKTVKEIDYEILENHTPVVENPVEDKLLNLVGSAFTVDPTEVFSDPDGEELKYDVKTESKGILSVSISDEGLVIVKSYSDGADTVILTATDNCGKSCSTSFRVGSFDDRNGPGAYPNPVSDKLNICVGGKEQTTVKLYSSAGAKLYETSAVCSVLDPITIDMSSYAPGRYSAVVSYNGNEFTKDIVKL